MGKLNRPKPASNGIPSDMTDAQAEHPSICLYHFSDTVMPLDSIPPEFFSAMIRQLKLMASLPWDQIYRHKGLGWDKVDDSHMRYSIPTGLQRNALHHLKVSRRGRMWGYRKGNAFYVVWLDPNHDVTPE